MNAILDFYGVYGTESALSKNRSIFRKLALKIQSNPYLSSKTKLKRLVNIIKDFDNLSTENLTDKGISVKYSLDFIKYKFDIFDQIMKHKELLQKVNEDMNKFLPNFLKIMETIARDSNEKYGYVLSALGLGSGAMTMIRAIIDQNKGVETPSSIVVPGMLGFIIGSILFLVRESKNKKRIKNIDKLEEALMEFISDDNDNMKNVFEFASKIDFDKYSSYDSSILKDKADKEEYIKVVKDFYDRNKESFKEIEDISSALITSDNAVKNVATTILEDLDDIAEDAETGELYSYQTGKALTKREEFFYNSTRTLFEIRSSFFATVDILIDIGMEIEKF